MDQKNARTPKDIEEEDPLDQEETPQKKDYGFGVEQVRAAGTKEPSTKKDTDEEDSDPLDDEEVEEESDPPTHQPNESLNTDPVEEELDREKTLADLAKEDIEDPIDLPQESEKPFKTNNIDLDTPISERNNPYFQSERQHENLRQPNFSQQGRPQPDLGGEDLEEQNAEIHIPNLRSPRFNPDYMSQRKALDEPGNDPDIGFGNRGLNSSQNPFERNSFRNGPPPRKGTSKLHLVVLLFIGVAVIGGTVYFLKTQFKPNSQVVSETTQATPTPTPAPTPTPEPEANRADFKVQVLNGTTTSGLAGEITTKLTELGYQTIKGANAPKQDYEQTLISVKEGQEVLLKTLIKDLSSQFEASAGPTLKAADSLDAQIILGKK